MVLIQGQPEKISKEESIGKVINFVNITSRLTELTELFDQLSVKYHNLTTEMQ